jgi:hypothetical protein
MRIPILRRPRDCISSQEVLPELIPRSW